MLTKNVMSRLKNASTLFFLIFSFVKCERNLFPEGITSEVQISDPPDCAPHQPVENGHVIFKDYMGRTTAFISCNRNFTLIGKSLLITECIDGEWKFGFDETLPKCEKKCPPPPYLEHGDLHLEKKLEDVYAPTGTYLDGTVATYTCKQGYILEPSSSSIRVCRKGLWTGTDAFCKPTREINCLSPPEIENGYMQPSYLIEYTTDVPVGQEVLYQCGHGYKLVGSHKIKCTELGVWSPEAPSCHKDTGNPFADFSAPAPAPAVSNGIPDFFSQPAPQPTVNLWGSTMPASNAFQAPIQQPTSTTAQQQFNDLTSVFNTTETSVFDPLGPVEPKQPPMVPPQPNLPPQRPPQPSKIITGDLESSLNSLVENLTIDSSSGKWNSPKNQPKTSTASGWQPQQMAATNVASYRPMMGAQPQMMAQQPFMGGNAQFMGSYQQPQMTGSPKIGAPVSQPQEQTTFDPFGAL